MSQTLERGLTILDLVAERPRRIREIADQLEVHHSTALRLLHSLRRRGFVFELPDHRYRLGSTLFRLGYQAYEAVDLKSVARPLMVQLSQQAGETVHLATLEEAGVVYMDKVEPRHRVETPSRVGGVAPLHSSALGKVILAFLPRDRSRSLLECADLSQRTVNTLTTVAALEADLASSFERGYALDMEENDFGICCLGVPVFGCGDGVEGAVSITAFTDQVDRVTLVGYLPALSEMADAISREMGWLGS